MVLRSLIRLSYKDHGLPLLHQACAATRLSLPLSTRFNRFASSTSERPPWYERWFIPMTLRPSFWKGMIPIPLRKEARDARKQIKKTEPRRRQANPATYFIMIFVLIGSFGIHFISLRHRYQYHSRQLDNRIAKLQQVLRRVQAGEDVDVETALGTGNAVAEKEWEEVMERIREEDRLWSSKERKKARKQARKEAREAAEAAMQAEKSTKSSDQFAQTTDDFGRIDEQRTKNKRTPGFY